MTRAVVRLPTARWSEIAFSAVIGGAPGVCVTPHAGLRTAGAPVASRLAVATPARRCFTAEASVVRCCRDGSIVPSPERPHLGIHNLRPTVCEHHIPAVGIPPSRNRGPETARPRRPGRAVALGPGCGAGLVDCEAEAGN